MRLKSVLFAAALVAVVVGPARAQYVAPFGSWYMAPPEAVGGLMGATAASNAAAAQQCVTTPMGRGGMRTQCAPAPQSSGTPRR